jgi:hypothetical protein
MVKTEKKNRKNRTNKNRKSFTEKKKGGGMFDFFLGTSKSEAVKQLELKKTDCIKSVDMEIKTQQELEKQSKTAPVAPAPTEPVAPTEQVAPTEPVAPGPGPMGGQQKPMKNQYSLSQLGGKSKKRVKKNKEKK